MNRPKNLLIVRTDRIGDVVLSLPVAGIIKKHFPDCKVTFLVREYTRPLVENNPDIDSIITLAMQGDKILLQENVKQIKEYKFDTAIVVYPTFITSLIIFLSRIKQRIGTGYRWYSLLFNKKIYEHRKYAERHELEYNTGLLKAFGINETVNRTNIYFNLKAEAGTVEKIDHLLKEEGITKPFLIIHPGSGGSSVDLPVDKFREMIEMTGKNLPVNIILTGSEKERDLCESLRINENTKNFAGKFDLKELTALISRSFLFISNSTGPIHIAAALDKYTIGFYPKILACSPVRWGPYSEKAVIFQPEIECNDCTREQCARLDCMNTIKVIDIFAEIEKIYKFIVQNGDFNV
jgi:heptosyltransferase III